MERVSIVRRVNELMATSGDDGVAVVALHGISGTGKSQLVRYILAARRHEFEVGWWIPARTRLDILSSFDTLRTQWGLPPTVTAGGAIPRIHDLLADTNGWSLVFDDCDDPSLIDGFIPSTGPGVVVITTHNPNWGGMAIPYPVGVLELDEAIEFVVTRGEDPDRDAARDLAEALDCLPLALEQSAAYCEQEGLRTRDYVELLEQQHDLVLRSGRPRSYQSTVYATFSLALDALRVEDEAAACFFDVCCWYDTDLIPLERLASSWIEAQPPTVSEGKMRHRRLVAVLQRAGLALREEAGFFSVHTLIRGVARHKAQDARSVRNDAVATLVRAFPPNPRDPEVWDRSAQLLPLVLAASETTFHDRPPRGFAMMLNRAGLYLRYRGLDLALSQQLQERAVEVLRLGTPSAEATVDEAWYLHDLADVLRDRQRLSDAEGLYSQALTLLRRVYGEDADHPDVAHLLSNVGNITRQVGHHDKARKINEESLHMRYRLYGRSAENLDIAQSLFGLGLDFEALGRSYKARDLYKDALRIYMAVRGRADHPDVGRTLNNIGNTWAIECEWRIALSLHGRALRMFLRLYGDRVDHVRVATAATNVAIDLTHLGRHRAANQLMLRAATMWSGLGRPLVVGETPSLQSL